MEGFTNVRMKAVPEIGIMERDINLLLEIMRKMTERYDEWPKKGTWRILWQEEGCEAQEILNCNFAEGVSEYDYHFEGGMSSGGGTTTTDAMVDDALDYALRYGKLDSGIYSEWYNHGVRNLLVLNIMKGRILMSINTMTKRHVSKAVCRYELKDSEEDQQNQALMAGMTEALKEILSTDALYCFAMTGDAALQKSMQKILCQMTSDEKEMVDFVTELLMAREISEEEKERRRRVEEMKLEIINLRKERLFGSTDQ